MTDAEKDVQNLYYSLLDALVESGGAATVTGVLTAIFIQKSEEAKESGDQRASEFFTFISNKFDGITDVLQRSMEEYAFDNPTPPGDDQIYA